MPTTLSDKLDARSSSSSSSASQEGPSLAAPSGNVQLPPIDVGTTIYEVDTYHCPAFHRNDEFRSWKLWIVRMLLVGWWLVPLRLLLLGGAIVTNWVLNIGLEWLFHLGHTEQLSTYSQMGPRRRWWFEFGTRLAARMCLIAWGIFRVQRKHVSEEQLRQLRSTWTHGYGLNTNHQQSITASQVPPFIICANHTSHIDSFLAGVEFGVTSAVAKKQIQDWIPPIAKTFTYKCEYHLFDGDRDAGRQILELTRDACSKYYEHWRQCIQQGQGSQSNTSTSSSLSSTSSLSFSFDSGIDTTGVPPRLLVFSEGTAANGEGMLLFHRGAFTTGTPVQPVVFRYPHKRFNPAVCGHPKQFLWIIASLSYLWQNAEVIHFPPYMPSLAEQNDPALYASNVRRVMAAGCNLFHPDAEHDKSHMKLWSWFYKRVPDSATSAAVSRSASRPVLATGDVEDDDEQPGEELANIAGSMV